MYYVHHQHITYFHQAHWLPSGAFAKPQFQKSEYHEGNVSTSYPRMFFFFFAVHYCAKPIEIMTI